LEVSGVGGENIKINFKETVRYDLEWNVQNTEDVADILNTVINLWVP
jgi:hypothetical protein